MSTTKGAARTSRTPRSSVSHHQDIRLTISFPDARMLLALLETTDQYPDVVDVLRQAIDAVQP